MSATWWVEPCLWDDEPLPDWEFPAPEPERGVEDVPIVIGELL
ncbi:hypothetical protein [Streptomyces albireticuli]|nr:hypothetical protein [Streptomyces albireticuli]